MHNRYPKGLLSFLVLYEKSSSFLKIAICGLVGAIYNRKVIERVQKGYRKGAGSSRDEYKSRGTEACPPPHQKFCCLTPPAQAPPLQFSCLTPPLPSPTPQPSPEADVGPMWGRWRADVGLMWGRCMADVGPMRGRCRPFVESMWGWCGADVGPMKGRCDKVPF